MHETGKVGEIRVRLQDGSRFEESVEHLKLTLFRDHNNHTWTGWVEARDQPHVWPVDIEEIPDA